MTLSRAGDSVPYVSRRRALVTGETYQAFHDRYTLEMRRRTNAVIDAYFATAGTWLQRFVVHPLFTPPDVGNLMYVSQLIGIGVAQDDDGSVWLAEIFASTK